MIKRIGIAGLSGGAVMFVWLVFTNALLPIKNDLIHRTIPLQDQLEVHRALAQSISEAGTYSIPYLSHDEETQFPDYRNQPVYTVIYQEYSHSGDGGESVMTSLPVILLAIFAPPLIAACLLSLSSPAVRSSYWRRVVYVAAIGVIVALGENVLQMSFGPLGVDYLSFLAINSVVAWVLTGIVIAALVKPEPA